MPSSNRSGSPVALATGRPRRIGGSPWHRAVRLYPDPSGDGGGLAPVEVTGRADRIGESPRLSHRRLAGGSAPAARIPSHVVAGIAWHQRRDDGHDGTGVLDARLPGSALYRRSGECLRAGPGVSAGARSVGIGTASASGSGAFRRRRSRDRCFGGDRVLVAGSGVRMARPVVWRRSRGGECPGSGRLARAAERRFPTPPGRPRPRPRSDGAALVL